MDTANKALKNVKFINEESREEIPRKSVNIECRLPGGKSEQEKSEKGRWWQKAK